MSFLILALIIVSCDSLSIGFSKNVKRDIDINYNPDWLKLNNKQDSELREFVEVKSKPKKRLAMPMNFILRAVAEPEGGDYFDKGQGESDNEDYFEKKEWSDVHRSVQEVDAYTPLNAKNLSDIEDIVHILTKPVNHPLTKVSKNRSKKNKRNKDKPKRLNDNKFSNDNTSEDESEETKKDEVPSKKNKLHRYEDDVEYEDGISEKPKSKIDSSKEVEQRENEAKEAERRENEAKEAERRENEAKEAERRENEAKKAKILEGVDELKLRHAEEQRTISENAKEEEIHKEEIERDRIKPRNNVDKYDHNGSKWKKVTQDYSDEYDDQESELKDKYKINHWKSTTRTSSPQKAKPRKNKTVATGKLSVFRNPHLYMVNEDEDDVPTTTTTTSPKPTELKTPKPKIYSSRYSKSPEEDNVRISLVPEDESKEGEPTLFFPKIKDRRRQRIKTTRAPNLNFNEEKTTLTSDSEATVPFVSYNKTTPTSEDAAPSATHTLASTTHTLAPQVSDTASTTNLDLKSSPSDEKPKKEEIKNEDYDIKSGKGKKYSSEHDEVHEEHGKKAYEGVHKEVKTDKGHHDKEDYLDKYDDQGTIDKLHHDEKKHYGIHHHEEHGKKHAKYEESGKHSKGHSTKGSHDIHKKDEYEKKVEFFEEEGDSFDDEGDGGHHSEKDHSSGDHFKKGFKKAGYAGHSKGETGHFGKGAHGSYHKGHKQAAGHDSHGKHGAAHYKHGGAANGRKWVFHHGHPAKTANLVVIDRRTDAYQHGPQYYG